nr:proline-rich protein 36-like [Aegilops tauschii subsp. strangulata]
MRIGRTAPTPSPSPLAATSTPRPLSSRVAPSDPKPLVAPTPSLPPLCTVAGSPAPPRPDVAPAPRPRHRDVLDLFPNRPPQAHCRSLQLLREHAPCLAPLPSASPSNRYSPAVLCVAATLTLVARSSPPVLRPSRALVVAAAGAPLLHPLTPPASAAEAAPAVRDPLCCPPRQPRPPAFCHACIALVAGPVG